MKLKKFFGLFLMVLSLAVVVSCGGNEDKKPVVDDNPTYTYRTYTAISPSNWNELTYQDNNDTQIMNYIGSSFFTFDFEFDANGEIVSGGFDVEFSAATSLVDVTKEYAGQEAWGIPATETDSRAYAITLRKDLKWEDGTPIKAEDFVYSMQEQLNPLFKNYRADSYYNSGTVIHNARNYFYQNDTVMQDAQYKYSTWDETSQNDSELVIDFTDSYLGTWLNKNYSSYCDAYGSTWVVAALGGPSQASLETIAGKTYAEIAADEELKAVFDALVKWWVSEPNEELTFFAYSYTYPEMSFDEVGIFVGDNEYEIVLILDKTLSLLEEDGSLNYKAAYNLSSLPLVHKAKYEATKVAPSSSNTLWTSQYNSSQETTMSWGPYRLESFQEGKQYVLVRNENWYGYNMKENEGLYQTDRIVCDTIAEWSSAFTAFKAGQIDSIGIDVSIASEYKGSARAIFTPDDYVGSLQLQSDRAGLEAREEDGVNKTILLYDKFRKALSLSIDRAEYTKKCTTASLAGFGLFNSMHYYDVAHAGVYRNEDVAKETLCKVYGVNVEDYRTLDEAYATITGYNLELARQLVDEAYDEAVAAGDIAEGDVVKIQFGSSVINDSVRRSTTFIQSSWLELVKGTKLEGRLEFEEIKDAGDNWADDFKAGNYDVCQGGWNGAAWDPGYFLLAYLGDDYRYAQGWHPETIEMEFTMPGVGENGEDVTDTLTLDAWYDCLNGAAGAKYNWAEGKVEHSKRLLLIAALEEQILTSYYVVPISYYFSASLLSFKVEYLTTEYNTFMGYGGIKYLSYKYSDNEWTAAVEAAGGEIDYR